MEIGGGDSANGGSGGVDAGVFGLASGLICAVGHASENREPRGSLTVNFDPRGGHDVDSVGDEPCHKMNGEPMRF